MAHLYINMEKIYFTYYESPVGLLKIGGTDHYITELSFVDNPDQVIHGEPGLSDIIHQCTEELIEFFNCKRTSFDIPVMQDGTAFQQKQSVTLIWLKGLEMQKSSGLRLQQMEKIILLLSYLVTG